MEETVAPPAENQSSMPSRARLGTRVYVFALSVIVIFLWRPVAEHVRAVELLARFVSNNRTESTQVLERELSFDDGPRRLPMRMYGTASLVAPTVVLVHGVHYKGIDEPRLQR